MENNFGHRRSLFLLIDRKIFANFLIISSYYVAKDILDEAHA